MITIQAKIEDKHGIVHENPVFKIRYYNIRKEVMIHGEPDEDEHDVEERVRADYSILMWTNQKAYDENKTPLGFTMPEGGTNRNFTPSTFVQGKEDSINEVETDFVDNVLPEYMVE